MAGRASTGAAVPRILSSGFVALLLAQAGFGYAFSSFLLLPIFMAEALGAGPEDVGRITAVHGVAVVCFLPLLGVAVDRHGRRDYLTAGALLMAATSAAFAWVDGVGPLLYALRVLHGLAFAMAFAAGGALAVDLAPPDRVGQAIGLFGLTFLSMNGIAPIVVEGVAERAGWPMAFTTAAAGALLCALLSRRLTDPERAGEERSAEGALDRVAVPGARAVGRLLVIGLVGAALIGVFSYLQLYARTLGIERVSAFFTAYAIAAVSMRAGLGHLIDRWGHRRSAVTALMLYVAVVLSVLALADLGLVAIGAALGLAHGVFYPAYNALAVSDVGAARRGRAMARFQAAFQVGASVGGLALGVLAERVGYPAVFQAAAACLLLALLLLLASPDGRRRKASG